MITHPEAALQTKINQWVRENVPHPHFFFAVDRRQKSGKFSHVREKARGHVAGTPDTILLFPGLPAIAIELKAPGNRPTDAQENVGEVIGKSEHLWGWCDSVVGYRALLVRFGVPLSPYSEVKALGHDATLASAAIRREETKTGRPSAKRRPDKPSAARVRKMEAIRARVLF